MNLFLLIAAIVAALAVALIGYGFHVFRRLARKGLADLPSAISVIPSATDWKDPAKAVAAEEELQRYRFHPVGRFSIPEFGILVEGFVNEPEQIAAMVFEHNSAGVWTDVTVQYANGEGLTVSNAPHGEEIDTRPGQTKIIDSELDAGALVRVMYDFVQSYPRKCATPQDFPAFITETYARDYQWRKSRGGTTLREVAKILDRMEKEKIELPCGGNSTCPYDGERCSERDIEGMPFPDSQRDPRACPTYGHVCPAFMEHFGLTPDDLAIRATIHCGSLAESLVRQGKLKNDSREYQELMARYIHLTIKYPRNSYPKYY